MKKIFPFLAALILVAGCANRYDITLSNGTKYSGVSKPVLHQETGEYYFTDVVGRKLAVKQMRVRVIEPHQDEAERSKFKNVAPR